MEIHGTGAGFRLFSAAAIMVLLAGLGVASWAAAASVYPSFQSGTSPYAASWELSWGHEAPYDVDFFRGDGSSVVWRGTYTDSYSDSRTFWTCVSETYYQDLYVVDGAGEPAYAGGRTSVSAGACR